MSNSITISKVFTNLPEEIIKIIVSYDNVIIFRYGKYMSRILSDDKRYKMLQLCVKNHLRYTDNRIAIWYNFPDNNEKNNFGYNGFVFDYKYSYVKNSMKITKKYFFKTKIGYLYSSKHEEKYIIDAYGYWRKVINYVM